MHCYWNLLPSIEKNREEKKREKERGDEEEYRSDVFLAGYGVEEIEIDDMELLKLVY